MKTGSKIYTKIRATLSGMGQVEEGMSNTQTGFPMAVALILSQRVESCSDSISSRSCSGDTSVSLHFVCGTGSQAGCRCRRSRK